MMKLSIDNKRRLSMLKNMKMQQLNMTVRRIAIIGKDIFWEKNLYI